jgi:DNA polymerase-1
LTEDSSPQLSLLAGLTPAAKSSDAAPEPKPKPAAATPPAAAPRSSDRPTVYLVDGPNIAFRAHYAIRNLTNSRGEATGALYGYCAMLFKLLKDYQPDYLVLCWDPPGGTFRNEIYPEYKGTRPDMPTELRRQMPIFPDVAAALGFAHVVVPGFEADDVIGTLATRWKEQCDVTIVSGDKDMMQLVDTDRVTILDTMKDMRIGPAEVVAKWGVPPERIIDILALMGDSSDNIPGVAGIGKKGAADLIQSYGPIEAVFENAEEVKGRSRKPLLAEGAWESAQLSYRLATIDCDMDLAVQLDDAAYSFPPVDTEPVRELFQTLEFHRFLSELGGEMKSLSSEKYMCVTEDEQLRELVAALSAADVISIDTETTSIDSMTAELVGISLCVDDERAWYVPVGHTGEGADSQLPASRVKLHLKSILGNPQKQFIGQNLKYDAVVLARAGMPLGGVAGDTLIASYLLNPGRRSHKLDGLALTWLQHRMTPYDEVTQDTDGAFAPVALADATHYAAEDAHVVYQLHPKMLEALDEADLVPLYRDVETPLVPVLGRMERQGILLDSELLRAYSAELAVDIEAAEALCWEHAGREFNSASPKQLAEILFEELGLPVIRKTKTGPSTDASVLEELAPLHELPQAILRFRMLAKLKSTYVDALPPLVHPETGRIHTSFNQSVAATGRLSSNNPNLQNIPIRTAEGRRVRQAFVAEPGYVLLSADYSQVELRLLAHLCGGEGGFARAFASGRDVHRSTASEVFEVPESEVTDEQRRAAKAINFGLVYGQTEYGLARALHISRAEAGAYIERYKERYPEIDSYMETTVEFAREHGYVSTLLGRRRPITGLSSSNYNQRQAARRTAVNTPVQGSAADVIKVAMLRVDEMLERGELGDTRMLLQVHDELVLEVPEERLEQVRARVTETMENAVPLDVSLKVESGDGGNWEEAH